MTDKGTDTGFDASKYATKDALVDIMNLSGVDRDAVVIFQDKHGVLKTSNINWNDIVRRVHGAAMDNISVFTDSGKLRDLALSIVYIRKIKHQMKMRQKRYVDPVDGKLSTLIIKYDFVSGTFSTLKSEYERHIQDHNFEDGKLSTLRAEHDVHVGAFVSLRRNFRKINYITDEFFGKPLIVDTKLSDVQTSIETI
ncbi:hypothetical protein ACJMK2_044642 [Sinanodonta woodiana]|uniref:Uncharacterized protein n=1 Tax=Sinanodonta woodiana TaxID=1069815 RepID=A0ABD3W0Q3_SINWO